MAPVVAGVGLVLLVLGILAVAAGFGLMVFTQDDAGTQASDGGVFADPQPGPDGAQGGRFGQTVAVGGGAVAFLGLVFIVVGRAD